MEKLIAMVICTILVVALVGCSTSKDGNYPATIMVNGTNNEWIEFQSKVSRKVLV